MTIIGKIACSRLNLYYSEKEVDKGGLSYRDIKIIPRPIPNLEVFVQFDDNENPIAIMCNEYDTELKGCRLRELTRENNKPVYGKCIHSSWKSLE